MADIRINSLSTTAASTASDDFVAVDGSANGTRKLNAYSPTFGGNLTVSGDASVGTSVFKIDSTNTRILLGLASALQGDTLEIQSKTNAGAISLFGRASDNQSVITFRSNGSNTQKASIQGGDAGISLVTGLTAKLSIDSAGATTLAGNLTVSGTGQVTGSSTGDGLVYNALFGNVKRVMIGYDETNDYGLIASVHTGTSWKKLAINPIGGNVLIGKTTPDTGERLQVAGTSYFNGAATFTSSGTLTGSTTIKLLFVPGALGTYGTSNILRWYRADGTTQRALIGYGSGNDQVFYLATEESGGSLVFQTGSSTTALTLDTSQNATFAGKITAGEWLPVAASKMQTASTANNYVVTLANTASSGNGYGLRLHTNLTTSSDYLLVASSGADAGTIRFIVKSNGTINAPSLPTSASGLSAGDIWNDGGTLKIV